MRINKAIVLRAIAKKYNITVNNNNSITVRLPGGKIKKQGKYKSGIPAYIFDYAGKKYYFQTKHLIQYIKNGKIEYTKSAPTFMYCEVCDYTYPRKEMKTSNICSMCWSLNYHDCRRWEKSSYTATKKPQCATS